MCLRRGVLIVLVHEEQRPAPRDEVRDSHTSHPGILITDLVNVLSSHVLIYEHLSLQGMFRPDRNGSCGCGSSVFVICPHFSDTFVLIAL